MNRIVLLISLGLLFAQAIPANQRTPLEIDEQVTFYIADGSTPGSVYSRAIEQSATPPGYFWLVRASLELGKKIQVGSQEFWLRFPSLVCYALAIWLAYRIGEREIGSGAGAAAALILSCHVYGIAKLALQARPYALGMLLVLWSFGALRSLLRNGWNRRDGASFFLANALLPWTHYLFVVFWPAQMLILLANRSRERRLPVFSILLIFIGSALFSLPLLAGILRVQANSQILAWITEPPNWNKLLVLLDLRSFGIAIAVAAVSGFLSRAPRLPKVATISIFVIIAIPVAILWLSAALIPQPTLAEIRYLSPIVGPMALFIAGLLHVVSRGNATLICTAAMILLSMAPIKVVANIREPVWHDSEWKDAALLIRKQAGPHDIIFALTGLVESRLVPIEFADEGFQEYTTSRLSGFYLDRPLSRYALPFVWNDLNAKWIEEYSRHVAEAQSKGGKIWLVVSADTDIGQNAERSTVAWFQRQGIMLTVVRDQPVAKVLVSKTP